MKLSIAQWFVAQLIFCPKNSLVNGTFEMSLQMINILPSYLA